jgi:valyl-tRNA synthetase
MIMAGLYYFPDSLPMEKRIPFRDVYFTGMVRDKQGRKMSKSLGNSPDLLGLIDKYGADAVRFGIMIASPAGNDLLFDEAALEQGRNFNNKLWNALKLVKMWESRLEPSVDVPDAAASPRAAGNAADSSGASSLPFAITWFDNRLREARALLEQSFKEFRLSEALKTLYSLIWDDFCSWYLEWVKPTMGEPTDIQTYQHTICFFEQLLQLLHPYMPFITEEIYHLLADRAEGDDLCIRQFGPVATTDVQVLAQGSLLKESITALRDARNKAQLKPKESIQLHILPDSEADYHLINGILGRQVNAESIAFTAEAIKGALTIVSGKDKYYIVTEQALDNGNQKEELQKELIYLKGFLDSVNKKLSNERFVQNAKPEVVDLERHKKEDAEIKIRAIEESLAAN